MIEIRLLGQFSVRWDGAAVEMASRPAQSLFAYLLLNAEVAHRRERLAGLLWPDSSEENARRNLRQALWQVRRALDAQSKAILLVDDLTLAVNDQTTYWLDTAAPFQGDVAGPVEGRADAGSAGRLRIVTA